MINELPTDHADLPKKNNEDSISGGNDANQYDISAEEKGVTGEMNQLPDLQRRLKSRHLSMIAIGTIRVYTVQKSILTSTQAGL
jgi:amino acid transporter